MKKKILVISALLIVITAALMLYDAVRTDPNFILKKTTTVLSEGKTENVTFSNNRRFITGRYKIPVFSFIPDETAEYDFAITDISSDADVLLTMNVTDKHLTDYIAADNEDDPAGDMSGTAYLTEGTRCFIIIEPVCADEDKRCTGSFSITVTKAAEEIPPAEITLEEAAVITVNTDEQTAGVFRPEESGYYRFVSEVVSANEKAAYSGITSVTSSDSKEVKVTEGICDLEGGKEYFIWVTTEDVRGKTADVKVSCKRIDIMKAEKPGSYLIARDTIIQFKASETIPIAVYSGSDGDMTATVYDSNRFPLSSDDDSGEQISGNPKDFALVFQAQEKNVYWIFAEGKFTDCRIVITRYTGDGTSIGPQDIEQTEDAVMEPLQPETDIETDIGSEQPEDAENADGNGTE